MEPNKVKPKKSKLDEMVPASRASLVAEKIRAGMNGNKESILLMSEMDVVPVATISTGSVSLDLATGVGGLPQGRIVEIIGYESSGKTTIALQVCAAAQKHGGTVTFIDAEHALDLNYAQALGLDTTRTLISQPMSGEEALQIAGLAAEAAQAGDVVVVDSVAALCPQAELDGEIGDAHMGLQARMMGQAMRKLTGIIHKSGVLVIFINQYRQKIGVMFGDNKTTSGGNALKFYASMRIEISRTGTTKVGEEAVSNQTRAKIIKNKVSPPFREARFDIRFGKGVDLTGEIADYAESQKLVDKSGSWFSINDQKVANGREAFLNYLNANPEVKADLYTKVREVLKIA